MALQPGFFTGPPPTAVKATIDRSGNVFYGVNPDFNRWIQNLWNWTVKFGNNADGAAAFSGKVQIGTSPNWFVADSNGIYLGGATFAASPFRVSMAGALTCTSGTFSGSITGASGDFSGNVSTAGYLYATGGTTVSGYSASVIGIPSATGNHGVLGIGKVGGGGRGVHAESLGNGEALAAFASGTGAAIYAVGNTSQDAIQIVAGAGKNALQTTGTISCGAINGTTIPSSATLLTSGGALGTPSSGTLTNCSGSATSLKSGYMVSPDGLKNWRLDNTQNGTDGSGGSTTYLKFVVDNNGTVATVWVAAKY